MRICISNKFLVMLKTSLPSPFPHCPLLIAMLSSHSPLSRPCLSGFTSGRGKQTAGFMHPGIFLLSRVMTRCASEKEDGDRNIQKNHLNTCHIILLHIFSFVCLLVYHSISCIKFNSVCLPAPKFISTWNLRM